jgi:putative ABC transport system permease protein
MIVADGLRQMNVYPLRTTIAVFAVSLAVVTVVSISSVIAGAEATVRDFVERLGSSVVSVGAQAENEQLRPEELRARKALSLEEVDSLASHCASLRALAPLERLASTEIAAGSDRVVNTLAVATTASYALIHGLEMADGRFLSSRDTERRNRVIVLGSDLVERLFGRAPAIGQRVTVQGLDFEVVGIVARRGTVLGMNLDDFAVVPLGSLGSRPREYHFADAEAIPLIPGEELKLVAELRSMLRSLRRLRPEGADDFGISTQEDLLEFYGHTTGGVYALMVGLSLAGLLVGGVGIMNVMIVAVQTRRHEIGVRRALGARRRHIWFQFLAEAAAVSGAGGLLGLCLGWIATALIALFTPLPATISVPWSIIGFLSAVGTGVIFGAWPANKAANLDPVAALRHD